MWSFSIFAFPTWILYTYVAYFIVKLCNDLINVRRAFPGLPARISLLSGLNPIAFFMKPTKYLFYSYQNLWKDKYQAYEEGGLEAFLSISLFPITTTLIVSDAAALKEITSSRLNYPKPVKQYENITFFGDNIVSSEGDEWKKFRKISAPAFSEKNFNLVWDETVKIMLDLFDNTWKGKDTLEIGHCLDVTLPIALQVLSVAGFGRAVTSNDDTPPPPGHDMTFKEALQRVSEDMTLKVIAGNWMPNLTERIKKVRIAFVELEKYMKELIDDRRQSGIKGQDLFSGLLAASDEEDRVLSDSELMGNVFVFMIAGHETTAHTLCYVFLLLALYSEEQEKLYQHIRSVWPTGRLPTYQEMGLFTYSMAVFYETLRLFPPVVGIPKLSGKDNVLVIHSTSGEETKTIPVPKDTTIILNTAGLHFNPRSWPDPHAFKPERFLDDWPRDSFLPFSGGMRSCIGRKFSETEGIAILTLLISRFKVSLPDEPQFAHETFEEKKARLFSSKVGITLTPERVPLTVTRRL
ncbi:Cytochrome P450 [Mycena venus]|uniref:Cytochrome P450 n=1 Tax=Mycena venus TaxID=2733690 RepID=A0A8H6X236_9AGAR|nr:Cytochrome P450 [Mycena venus]